MLLTPLPAEIKHRGPNGCRVVVQTAARHQLSDVINDLRAIAIATRLEGETKGREQEAA